MEVRITLKEPNNSPTITNNNNSSLKFHILQVGARDECLFVASICSGKEI